MSLRSWISDRQLECSKLYDQYDEYHEDDGLTEYGRCDDRVDPTARGSEDSESLQRSRRVSLRSWISSELSGIADFRKWD